MEKMRVNITGMTWQREYIIRESPNVWYVGMGDEKKRMRHWKRLAIKWNDKKSYIFMCNYKTHALLSLVCNSCNYYFWMNDSAEVKFCTLGIYLDSVWLFRFQYPSVHLKISLLPFKFCIVAYKCFKWMFMTLTTLILCK